MNIITGSADAISAAGSVGTYQIGCLDLPMLRMPHLDFNASLNGSKGIHIYTSTRPCQVEKALFR